MQKKIPHFLLQAERRRPSGWLPLRTRIHFKNIYTAAIQIATITDRVPMAFHHHHHHHHREDGSRPWEASVSEK